VKFLSRLEPNLGELELAYRQHFLKSDAQQLTSLGWIYIAAMCVYVPIDFGLYGLALPFFLLLAARSLVVLGALHLLSILKRISLVAQFDRLLLGASVVSFSMSLLVHLLRSNSLNYNLSITVLLIVVNYLLLPIPFSWRFWTAISFSLLECLLSVMLTSGDVAGTFRNNLIGVILANLIGVVVSARFYSLRRNQFKAQIEEQQARLEIERLATTDALTGVFNRRKWLEEANRVLVRFLRSGQRFSVLYLDIDHFKRLNDTHGHAAGDTVLKHFAQVVAGQIRELDVLGRFGGEEFVVLLPETPLEPAKSIAGRIRAIIEASSLAVGTEQLRLTVSIGVTEVALEDSKIEDVLHRADVGLYQAKTLGRNRVEAL
jgi:diguanylate cyclase